MSELVNTPISPWYAIPAAVGLLALTFGLLPGVLLHLGVLLFPKGHDRRTQFTADLYDVPYIKRPFWVAGTLVRCVFEGLPARLRTHRLRRDKTIPCKFENLDLDVEILSLDDAITEFDRRVDYLGSLPLWRRFASRNLLIASDLVPLRARIRQLKEGLQQDPPA